MLASNRLARLFQARVGVAAVFGLNGFGYGSWVPRIAEIQQKLGLSEGQLGLALFMAAVGALLAMPLAGAAAHRYGSRAASALTVALYGLCLPGLALAPGPVGLGVACCSCSARRPARSTSSMNTQGVAVEKHLAADHGRRCTACSASAPWSARRHRCDRRRRDRPPAASARDRRADRSAGLAACRPMLPIAAEGGAAGPGFARPSLALLLPGLVALAGLLSEGAIGDWSAVYLSASLGAGTTMAAAAFAAFSLTMAAGRFTGDRLVAQTRRRSVVRAGGALAAAGLGLTLLIGHPLVAVAGFALVGAGLSCVFPVVLSAAARTPGVAPSAAIAAVCTVGYVGFLVGPPAIGGLAELIGLPRRWASSSCSAL